MSSALTSRFSTTESPRKSTVPFLGVFLCVARTHRQALLSTQVKTWYVRFSQKAPGTKVSGSFEGIAASGSRGVVSKSGMVGSNQEC